MTAKQYLTEVLNVDIEKASFELCFVQQRLVNDNGYEHYVAWSTPLRAVHDWKDCPILDSIVLNTKQPVVSWMSGADWNPGIHRDSYMSLLVITEEELRKKYGKMQSESMVKYIDAKISEEVEYKMNGWYNKLNCK